MAFDPGTIPGSLLQEYAKGRCGLLVGAGASVGAGLPQWGDLLRQMVAEAKDNVGISDEKVSDYESLIDQGRYLMAASGLKTDLGSFFAGFIRRVFVDSKPAPTELHEAIAQLA